MDKNADVATRLDALAADHRLHVKTVLTCRAEGAQWAVDTSDKTIERWEQEAADMEHAARVLRNPARVVISDAYKAVQAREEQLLRGGRAIGHFMRFVSKVRPLIDEAPHRLGAPAISAIDETLHDLAVALGIEKILFGEEPHG